MGNNKLQIKSLGSNQIDVRSKNYCSKCLGVLGDDMVKDAEGNEFCCSICRREFYLEIRQDMDDIMSEFK